MIGAFKSRQKRQIQQSAQEIGRFVLLPETTILLLISTSLAFLAVFHP